MEEQRGNGMKRRAFVGGLASLGILALLYFLIPSFLRRGKISPEPAPSPSFMPSAIPAEPETPVPAEKSPILAQQESSPQARETIAAASFLPLAVLYRDELKEYNFGQGRLFQGKRYGAFHQYLQEHLPAENYRTIEAVSVTDEDLLLISGQDYMDFNKQFFRTGGPEWPVNEQFLKYHLPDNKPYKGAGKVERAARLLVGQAKAAADPVQTGQFKKAVSVGGGMHHAFRKYGGAFSLYNDVAFCASYLIKRYGLERVLILDTDAHAGNGTSSFFYDDPRVLFIDIHQDPTTLYPGTGFIDEIGSGAGAGYNINIPLPPESDYECYRLAFESIVEPVTHEFQPQLIIWNGGADPHSADPITSLGLRTNDFRKLGRKVNRMMEISDGKGILFLMSGYVPDLLPVAWFGSVIGFGGFDYAEEEVPVSQESLSTVILHSKTEEVIKNLKGRIRHYWRSLQ